MAAVALVGSRMLSPVEFAPLVFKVVLRMADAKRRVVVGCASGADELVIGGWTHIVHESRGPLSVLAIGAESGEGFCRVSAPFSLIRRVASTPRASVTWLAGGPLSRPLVARLRSRSREVVAAAAAGGPGSGLIAFVSSASSPGSFLACRMATAAALPVVVFRCGFESELPLLAKGGRWAPAASSGLFAPALRWVPA